MGSRPFSLPSYRIRMPAARDAPELGPSPAKCQRRSEAKGNDKEKIRAGADPRCRYGVDVWLFPAAQPAFPAAIREPLARFYTKGFVNPPDRQVAKLVPSPLPVCSFVFGLSTYDVGVSSPTN